MNPNFKRYNIVILQNGRYTQTFTIYSSSNFGACKKALHLFNTDNPEAKGNITAIARHQDFYGNTIPEEVKRYNYSIAYIGA